MGMGSLVLKFSNFKKGEMGQKWPKWEMRQKLFKKLKLLPNHT